VDGNVVRILARLTEETQLFRDSATAAKYFTPLADQLIIGSHPGTHNQAMMELGATVCVRAKPLCPVCPVAPYCVARRNGEPEKIPRFRPKQIEQRSVARVWCEHRGRLLLKRGHATAKRLAGLYELPDFKDFDSQTPAKKSLIAIKRRVITRFQISESIYRVSPSADLLKEVKAQKTMEWVRLDDIATLTLSGPHKRWIAELLVQRDAEVR
jgi:A/G-specific adenine glycosylase